MKTQNEARTFLGLKEYKTSDGTLTQSLYDGHFEPQCVGTVEEVIQYLEGLLYLDDESGDWETWQGPNGWFYDGSEAGDILRAEIQALKEGTHFSQAEE